MLNKAITKILAFMIVLIVVTFIAREIVTGGKKIIELKTAPAFSGIVSQSLFTTKGSGIPVSGKDFSLINIHYFDDATWVVATVKPINNEFDTSLVVIERKQGVYKIVEGPGSAFPSDALQSMPTNVGAYLSNEGAFYEPVENE